VSFVLVGVEGGDMGFALASSASFLDTALLISNRLKHAERERERESVR
jgi:hypothetical protein